MIRTTARFSLAALALIGTVALVVPTQAQDTKENSKRRGAAMGSVAGAVPAKAEAKPVKAATKSETSKAEGMFAAPVLMKSGDANLGEGRLYPSPVLHDLDGDGKAEIYVGDLQGFVTVTHPGKDSVHWGKTERLQTRDGKDMKFNNW